MSLLFLPDLLHFTIFFFSLLILRRRSFVIQGRIPCFRTFSGMFSDRVLDRKGFCLLLGPPGFNCWFSFAPVFQWCCSTPQGSPCVGRNTFLSSPHLCFITVFICDLFVSRDDPLMS